MIPWIKSARLVEGTSSCPALLGRGSGANSSICSSQPKSGAGLSGISSAQQAQVSAALTTLFLQKDSPLATTSIEQSDCAAAITAIGGLPSFAITTPSTWPITSAAGYLFTLGTVTYS